MSPFARVHVSVLAVLATIHVAVAQAGDWDDIRLGNVYHALVGCSKFPDGNISISQSNAIYLDEFERAGVNDAAIAANAAGVAANTQEIAGNAAAIAQASAAADRNARAIAAQETVLDDAVAQINFQSYRMGEFSLQLADHGAAISDLYGRVERLDRKIARAAALFGAMDFQRPLPGKTFRVGMGGGTYDDESAVGWTFTAVVGPVDLSVGAALASGEYGGKASVGFSF